MAGYDYPIYVTDIGAALEVPVSDSASATPFADVNYNSWLPRAIEAAEQRIYRELDLMGTYMVDPTGALTPNDRRFTLPTDDGTFIVVTQVSVFNPAGTRNQLLPVTKEYLDFVWPTDVPAYTPSVPQVWCPFDQASIFIGPPADTGLQVEVTGTFRPAPLSSTNTTTPLTSYLPDLFMAASMVSWMGLQRDYGAQSGDPQQAVTWEAQYQTMKQSAEVEQFRVRVASQGWGARLPNPVATPPQT